MLDKRFIDIGPTSSQLNLQDLPDGSTRFAVTNIAQTWTGQKTFTSAPLITGAISLDNHAVNKIYVDTAIAGITPTEQDTYCIKPINSYGIALPTGEQTSGYRFFNTTDYKIYTYTTAFDMGVLVTKSFIAHVLSDQTIISYDIVSHTLTVHDPALATVSTAGLVIVGNGLSVSSGTVSLNLSATGGLSLDSNQLKVNIGSGLTIIDNTISVNQATLSFISSAVDSVKASHLDFGTSTDQINLGSIPDEGVETTSKVAVTLGEKNRIPTSDISGALAGATSPSSSNVYVTSSVLTDSFNGKSKSGVQTISDLILLTDHVDKDIRLVEDDMSFWRYDAESSATSDGATIVTPTGVVGNGRWLKVITESGSTPELSMTFTAGEAISANSIVKLSSGKLYKADNHTEADADSVLGIVKTNVETDATCKVLLYGYITDSVNTYVIGNIIYCGPNGSMVTLEPIANDVSAKFSMAIGFATGEHTLFMRFGSPLRFA